VDLTGFYYKIPRNMIDILKDIYLEIELDDSLFELSSEQKYELFDTYVNLCCGGKLVTSNKILSCIFSNIISGRNIKYDNNIIQIPLFNFDTFVCQFYDIIGLPVVALIYHDIEIQIPIIKQSIKKFKYKIVANGFVCSTAIRNKILDTIGKCTTIECVMIESQNEVYNVKSSTQKNILYFNHIIKCILVYFIPEKDTYADQDFSPNIESIKLHTRYKEILDFVADDLLDIEIFGIKIYLIPLCKEFSDWERIHECFKKVHKNISVSGINFSRLDEISIELNLNISSGYNIVYNALNLNSCAIVHGMMVNH
jgi:hypothetical protein